MSLASLAALSLFTAVGGGAPAAPTLMTLVAGEGGEGGAAAREDPGAARSAAGDRSDAARVAAGIEGLSSCDVRELSPGERRQVESALRHARHALGDLEVQAVLLGQRELVVRRAEAYPASARAGGAVLLALVEEAPVVRLATFGGRGCPRALRRPELHAFADETTGRVFLSRAWLGSLPAGPEGTRVLAGTLAHEAAHLLGYDHPPSDRLAYAAAVPVFVGCLIERFPAGERSDRSVREHGCLPDPEAPSSTLP